MLRRLGLCFLHMLQINIFKNTDVSDKDGIPPGHNVFEAYGYLFIYRGPPFLLLNMPLQQNYLFGTYLKITLGTLEVLQKEMAMVLRGHHKGGGLWSIRYFYSPPISVCYLI